MTTSRLCRICNGWHDLDEPWPLTCLNHFAPRGAASGQIIKDIEPYRTVAADVDGKQKVITSRAEHKAFLRRNGYLEVGNEKLVNKKQPLAKITGYDIKRAIEEVRSKRR